MAHPPPTASRSFVVCSRKGIPALTRERPGAPRCRGRGPCGGLYPSSVLLRVGAASEEWKERMQGTGQWLG